MRRMAGTRQEEFDDCIEMARTLLGGSEGAGDLWEANDYINRALGLRPADERVNFRVRISGRVAAAAVGARHEERGEEILGVCCSLRAHQSQP